MNTIFLFVITIVSFAAVVVLILRKTRKEYEDIKRSIERNEGIVKSIRKQQSIEAAAQSKSVPQFNITVPTSPVSVPQTPQNVPTQGTLAFDNEPEERKPVDPEKPKRKSPIEHTVVRHDDEFWLQVCREYQTLKHKNPNLTQSDFVALKNDPNIKIKTFNAKMAQLTKTGLFYHKPRKSKK